MLLKKWQLKLFDKNFLILKCSELSFTWFTLTLSKLFKKRRNWSLKSLRKWVPAGPWFAQNEFRALLSKNMSQFFSEIFMFL